MRVALCVVLALVMVAFVVGCVTAQEQADMDASYQRIRVLEQETQDVLAKIKTKELTLAEGEMLLRHYAGEVRRIEDQVRDLRNSGRNWSEIIGAMLVSILGSLGATRVWRGSVNHRLGNIGKT